MAIYGYHRVSTKEQHLDRGVQEITDYCESNGLQLEKIYCDKMTGKTFDRPRYKVLKEDVLRRGDILIIAELDRLGRDKAGIMKEIQYFRDADIRLMILDLPTTLQDFSGMGNEYAKIVMEAITNMILELYAAMAHTELIRKSKRQAEGIAAKKARGDWADYGRPAAMDFDQFKIAYDDVISGAKKPFEVMRELGLTKSTFYRYKQRYESEHK